jgi:hypothetical protein
MIRYQVYINIDGMGNVTKIFSTAFETPSYNSILIDEGEGDKYRHAQTSYLDKPLISLQGQYNYQYIGNMIIEKV